MGSTAAAPARPHAATGASLLQTAWRVIPSPGGVRSLEVLSVQKEVADGWPVGCSVGPEVPRNELEARHVGNHDEGPQQEPGQGSMGDQQAPKARPVVNPRPVTVDP